MKLLPAAGLILLLASLVAVVAFTPELFFGAADAEASAIVGHTAPHAAPQLACEAAAGGVARATLVAQETTWTFAAGASVPAWTFGGDVPGPVLCANEGDTVEVTVENRLPVAVSFHTHLPALAANADVPPGGVGTFSFRADQAGVYPYHDLANGNVGTARGLQGVLLVRNGTVDADHEVVMVLGEVNAATFPDTYAATVNGRAFPRIPHYGFERGERVLVHLVNFGPAEEHTLHIHGHRWRDVGDGRPIDNKFVSPHTAVGHADLGVPEGVVAMTHALAADRASFLFLAESEGEWMMHCHVYDHINAGMTGMLTVLPRGGEHHA